MSTGHVSPLRGRPDAEPDAWVRRWSADVEKALVVMQIALLTYSGKDPDPVQEKSFRSAKLRWVSTDFSGSTAATTAIGKGIHGER